MGAELAISLPLTLSILVEAVIAADLLGFVGDPSTAATVFAPTNDAFVALLEELQLDGLSEIPTDTLAQVLTYHVSDVVALSTDLMDGMEIPTLEGQSLTVDLSDGVVIEGVGSSANVIGPDNIACESVVHVIDTVLLPFALGPEPDCAARFAACETNEDCCSGTCRGSRFVFPFSRRCTLFSSPSGSEARRDRDRPARKSRQDV